MHVCSRLHSLYFAAMCVMGNSVAEVCEGTLLGPVLSAFPVISALYRLEHVQRGRCAGAG